jgi:hypothetical protein
MAYIDQTQTKKEIEDAIRGNSVSNIAPTKVNDDVQLVLNVNPKDYRRVNVVKSATSGTIYTTPSTKEFYLTGAYLSAQSTTVGSNWFRLAVTPFSENTSTIIAQVPVEVTVAISGASEEVYLDFSSCPIRLANSSNIATSTGGTLSVSRCCIFGYTVEL